MEPPKTLEDPLTEYKRLLEEIKTIPVNSGASTRVVNRLAQLMLHPDVYAWNAEGDADADAEEEEEEEEEEECDCNACEECAERSYDPTP